MIVDAIALREENNALQFRLRVRTNLWSILGRGPALKVEAFDDQGLASGYGFSTKFLPGHIEYPTISEFLDEWEIVNSRRHNIPLPFLKKTYLLGNVAGRFFARLGVYPHKDCGCPSRKEWWNVLLAFVPLDYKGKSI